MFLLPIWTLGTWIFDKIKCLLLGKLWIDKHLMNLLWCMNIMQINNVRRLTKHGTFTELRKIPISTEMSVVLLRKHETFDIS